MKKLVAGILALVLATPLLLVGMVVTIMPSWAAPEDGSGGGRSGSSCVIVPATGGVAASATGGNTPKEWQAYVHEAAAESGLPAGILAAQLEAESGWNPRAVSPVGAQGLAQFMPATWSSYGNGGDPFNPRDAIAAQGRYMGALFNQLKGLAAQTGGDPVAFALAGYNAGPGAVEKFRGVPPFGETQNYVAKIKAKAGSGDWTGSCKATASPGGTQDIYPHKDAPFCNTTPCAPGTANPESGMYYRECVDWVIYKLNYDIGSRAPPYKWTNANLLNGQGMAYQWRNQWQAHGWPVSATPVVGAVAWFDISPLSPMGHVATVAAVNADATVLLEEYNRLPNDHSYGQFTMPATQVSAFLYPPPA
ncbi:transglycosylase SLT domain-containing protein [Paenarthrobacter sp. NPDC056912]|uniref:transglycosylase SLT domain-containing protein n=1 Tax=Paenarthrobacter sp. NPDC056912 TaxID=3345965 RepID=UPI00366E24CA